MAEPFRTPDGRYIIVRRRLWRATNPQLDEQDRKAYVSQLMTARRKVKMALKSGDEAELKAARAGVQAAKVALGERGPVWWDDGAIWCITRRMPSGLPSSLRMSDAWRGALHNNALVLLSKG
jgi:hypothetical protein